MALPASGQISLSQFRTTFGGSAPDSVSEYRRGGGVADNAVNANVPQSGAASFSNYYSAAGIQTRNISVNMDYNLGFSAFGLQTQSSTAAPFSFGAGANTLCYQPVFRAGTGFITSASITVQQNEDTGSQSELVLLYGGTSSSNVSNIIARWDAGVSGSSGGGRTFSISWNSNGVIVSGGIVNTSNIFNWPIISFVTDNTAAANAAGYTWFGLRLKNPSSFSGKVGEVMTGTFYSTSITQPS